MYKIISLVMIVLVLITSCASQNITKSVKATQITKESEKTTHNDNNYTLGVVDNIIAGVGMGMFVI